MAWQKVVGDRLPRLLLTSNRHAPSFFFRWPHVIFFHFWRHAISGENHFLPARSISGENHFLPARSISGENQIFLGRSISSEKSTNALEFISP
jgi:hypothetical protein